MLPLRLCLWRAAVVVAVAAILPAVVVVLFSHRLLKVDSGGVKADAMVVLGGGQTSRPVHAAELYRAGVAPRIVVSGTGDDALNAQILMANGVPASAITIEDRSTSTLENAEFSIPLLRKMGAHRVILVTSWYHSRRALGCFRHFAPDIAFFSRPSYEDYRRRDWRRNGTLGYILREYVKLPGYWAVYGVEPVRGRTNPPSGGTTLP
jgi:uncharacterized SAM-binding protein YcdF (DUF218 family)